MRADEIIPNPVNIPFDDWKAKMIASVYLLAFGFIYCCVLAKLLVRFPKWRKRLYKNGLAIAYLGALFMTWVGCKFWVS